MKHYGHWVFSSGTNGFDDTCEHTWMVQITLCLPSSNVQYIHVLYIEALVEENVNNRTWVVNFLGVITQTPNLIFFHQIFILAPLDVLLGWPAMKLLVWERIRWSLFQARTGTQFFIHTSLNIHTNSTWFFYQVATVITMIHVVTLSISSSFLTIKGLSYSGPQGGSGRTAIVPYPYSSWVSPMPPQRTAYQPGKRWVLGMAPYMDSSTRLFSLCVGGSSLSSGFTGCL